MALRDSPPPYDAVVFDCDSTLSAMEGIEELARDNAEVARLTDEAMEGRIALEEVYGRRLALVHPSQADVHGIGQAYVEKLVPGTRALVRGLQVLGKRVYVLSGGLLPAVAWLARSLGIPAAHVFAVDVSFDGCGRYAGFDERSPLARAGGKLEVLRSLARPGERIALVGDGATDLEAAPAADRFIAFGGVERRAAVLSRSRIVCLDPDLRALAPLLLSAEEIATLSRSEEHGALLALPRGPTPPTA